MTEAEARAEVERKAQTALEPVLEAGEVDDALVNNRRFTSWAAETVFSYGDRVAPTVRNGRRYKVIESGTTGTTEPSWGTSWGWSTMDGTVEWEEDGPDGDEWDIRGAVIECLAMRYAKDQLVDADADGRNIKGSQRAERIRELMRLYQPAGAA